MELGKVAGDPPCFLYGHVSVLSQAGCSVYTITIASPYNRQPLSKRSEVRDNERKQDTVTEDIREIKDKARQQGEPDTPCASAPDLTTSRYVLTVGKRTQRGLPFLSASTSVSTAPPTIETWVCTSPSSAQPILIVRPPRCIEGSILISIVWQWDQLRLFKVGGNESATKFFQSNGGTAALASKDAKIKYGSNAANKYKEELKRRAAKDAQEYVDQLTTSLC